MFAIPVDALPCWISSGHAKRHQSPAHELSAVSEDVEADTSVNKGSYSYAHFIKQWCSSCTYFIKRSNFIPFKIIRAQLLNIMFVITLPFMNYSVIQQAAQTRRSLITLIISMLKAYAAHETAYVSHLKVIIYVFRNRGLFEIFQHLATISQAYIRRSSFTVYQQAHIISKSVYEWVMLWFSSNVHRKRSALFS